MGVVSTPTLPVFAKTVRFAAEADCCSEEPVVEITVLGISGDEMAVVHASMDCTVARLKTAIAAQSSVPSAGQELILGSCLLEDEDSMSKVLQACCCAGCSAVTMTLVVVPVDPFPKLYVDAYDTRITAQRAEQTPKAIDFEGFAAEVELPWALECKECDGLLHEKTRDYDFATPCNKGNYLKVSASMWCPTCRLVFEGFHKVAV